jgi:salicylate hydroxylase
VNHLVRLLVEHHPNADTEPSAAVFPRVITKFEGVRMERTATLVQGAREAGEMRVVEGVEKARARTPFASS